MITKATALIAPTILLRMPNGLDKMKSGWRRMTSEEREKAIDLLDNLIGAVEDNQGNDYDLALKMAIESLKQEPCEDAISRRAVLNTLDKMDSVLNEDRTVETYKELLTACYKDLPSVTPVHKKEWIPCSERLPEYPGIYMTTLDYGKHGLATGARYYHGKYFKWMNECVIAWMPLPEPYREESEGE